MADVEKLKEKKRQLDARIKKIESLEKTKKRKEDTRRKIIIGGALLALAARDPKSRKNIYQCLDDLVTNPKDRALIGLDVPQEQPSAAASAADPFKPDTDL